MTKQNISKKVDLKFFDKIKKYALKLFKSIKTYLILIFPLLLIINKLSSNIVWLTIIYLCFSMIYLFYFFYLYLKSSFYFLDLFANFIYEMVKVVNSWAKRNGKKSKDWEKIFHFIEFSDNSNLHVKLFALKYFYTFIINSLFQITLFALLFLRIYNIDKNIFIVAESKNLNFMHFFLFSFKSFVLNSMDGINSNNTLIGYLTLYLSLLFILYSTFLLSHVISLASPYEHTEINKLFKLIEESNSLDKSDNNQDKNDRKCNPNDSE